MPKKNMANREKVPARPSMPSIRLNELVKSMVKKRVNVKLLAIGKWLSMKRPYSDINFTFKTKKIIVAAID